MKLPALCAHIWLARRPQAAAPLLALFGLLLASPACAQVTLATQKTLLTGVQGLFGIAVDKNGAIYIASGNMGVLKESPTATGYTQTSLRTMAIVPLDVAVDSNLNVYISDQITRAVYKETPSGNGYIETTVATGFMYPGPLSVDAAGNVYVVDEQRSVYKETPVGSGYAKSTVGSGYGLPTGVAVDAKGGVYISEGQLGRIWKETPSGTSYASAIVATGLNSPQGIVVDAAGNLYVAEGSGNRVTKETRNGSMFAATTLGSGFNKPVSIAMDSKGNIDVADSGNQQIVRLSPNNGTFSPQPLGTSSAIAVLNFNIAAGTAVSKIAELTQGNPARDFVDAGASTCTARAYTTATSCVINLKFTPLAPGSRRGAVVFYDASGNPLVNVPVSGVGLGPQAGISSLVPQPATGPAGAANASAFAIDGIGDLFVAESSCNPNSGLCSTSAVEFPRSGSGYGAAMPIPTGLTIPRLSAMALDSAGDLFLLSPQDSAGDPATGSLVELPRTASGYGPAVIVSNTLPYPFGIAFDAAENLFVSSSEDAPAHPAGGSVLEFQKTGMTFAAPITIASGISDAVGIAFNAAGDLIVASLMDPAGDAHSGSVLEIPGYSPGFGTPSTILGSLDDPYDVVVESSGGLLISIAADSNFDPNTGYLLELLPSPAGYISPSTLLTGLDYPDQLALDNAGNVYFSLNTNGKLYELSRASNLVLPFASTFFGGNSPDSPQTALVENLGNEPLDLLGVSYPADFPEDISGDSTDCTAYTSLPPAANCTLTIDFYPAATLPAGKTSLPLSERATIDTNAFNVPGTLNTVFVSGTQTLARPTVALTPSTIAPTFYGPLALTATVSDLIPESQPTGSITFYLGGAVLGIVNLQSGQAVLNTTLKTVGPATITASYSGDIHYTAANAAPLTLTVSQATPAVVATVSTNSTNFGATVTIQSTIQIPSGAPAPAGLVVFYSNLVKIGSAPVSASKAALAISTLPVGLDTITAVYSGNTGYATATSAPVTVTVNPATPRIVLTSSATSIYLGTNVTFTATISGTVPGYAPSGTVVFFAGGLPLAVATVNQLTGVCSTQMLGVGADSITASFEGDFNYTRANSNPLTVNVYRVKPTVTLNSSTPGNLAGNPTMLNATVTSLVTNIIPGVIPSGTVSFYDGSTLLASAGIVAGSATATATLPAGNNSLTAVYQGDPNFTGATSAAQTVAITKSTPTIGLISSANQAPSGTNIVLTANILSGVIATPPTGTMNFYSDGTLIGSAPVSVFAANLNYANLPVGTHSLYARYLGDRNYNAASSPQIQVTITH